MSWKCTGEMDINAWPTGNFTLAGYENRIRSDRLQLAAWTIILGFVFVVEVVKDLTVLDFSPTVLGLMGISSGTYIGFRLPGKSS